MFLLRLWRGESELWKAFLVTLFLQIGLFIMIYIFRTHDRFILHIHAIIEAIVNLYSAVIMFRCSEESNFFFKVLAYLYAFALMALALYCLFIFSGIIYTIIFITMALGIYFRGE